MVKLHTEPFLRNQQNYNVEKRVSIISVLHWISYFILRIKYYNGHVYRSSTLPFISQGTADNDIRITFEKETECNVVRHEDKRMNDMILNYCEIKNVSYGFVCTTAEMLIVLRVQ